MGQEVIEIAGDAPAPAAFSWRRLFGLHAHAYGPWEAQFATPRGDGTMMCVSVRECAHCDRFELRREVADIPAGGIPFRLSTLSYATRVRG